MIERPQKRIRRTPSEAREHILSSAEQIMKEGGITSVQVRAVAREASMTDAGINHHFGSLDGLLGALLTSGAQKVRDAVDLAVKQWAGSDPDIRSLVEAIGGLYSEGYAELAIHLHKSGWQERGTPLLDPVVDALVAINSKPDTTEVEIRAALATLHLWLAIDPLYGEEFRRSAGLSKKADQKLQLDWWVGTLTQMLTK